MSNTHACTATYAAQHKNTQNTQSPNNRRARSFVRRSSLLFLGRENRSTNVTRGLLCKAASKSVRTTTAASSRSRLTSAQSPLQHGLFLASGTVYRSSESVLWLFKVRAALSPDGRLLHGADDDAFDVLVHLVEFVVLHEEAEQDDWDSDASGDDEDLGHRFLVRAVDGLARGAAHWPACGGESDVGVNLAGLVSGLSGKIQCQLLRHVRSPDCSGNRRADSATNLEESEKDGSCSGNLLMIRRCLDAQLSGHVEHAATDANKRRGSDKRRSGRSFDTVEDHRQKTDEVDASAECDEEPVALGFSDQEGNAEGSDCRGERPHLHNTARIGNRFALDDEEV